MKFIDILNFPLNDTYPTNEYISNMFSPNDWMNSVENRDCYHMLNSCLVEYKFDIEDYIEDYIEDHSFTSYLLK